MKIALKIWALALITALSIILVFLHAPIPQALAFHHFADQKTLLGIPNLLNVLTNLPFLIIGIYGLTLIKKSPAPKGIRTIYACLFSGILLTALGSAYYHGSPDNDRLVLDRTPMTLVFMSLLSATVAEYMDRKAGVGLLIPLLAIGVFSVLWWHWGEGKGQGDLRLYFLVQYYPMGAIPLIMLLFRSPAHDRASRQLIWVVVWYVIAKLLERWDLPIYERLGFVSGHSLKHLAAGVATWYLVRLFRQKYKSDAAVQGNYNLSSAAIL